MSLVPAYISLEDSPLPHLTFHFVPETLTITKATRWPAQDRHGAIATPLFQAANPATLKMKIWLDTTELPGFDVKGDAEKLLKLMKPGSDTNASLPGASPSANRQVRPPTLKFHWGATMSFRCVLLNATITFLLFDNSGRPLRATADCTFQQVQSDDDFIGQNPTSGGRTGERIHRVAPRETLDQVAYRSFGKTSLWRAIASFNGIDDPLRIEAGQELLLPPSADDLKEFA